MGVTGAGKLKRAFLLRALVGVPAAAAVAGGGSGRFWGSGSCLGICPGGVCGGGRCHAESGGGDLLSVVGISLDAQNSGIDMSESRAKLGGGRWCGNSSAALRARDEGIQTKDRVGGNIGGMACRSRSNGGTAKVRVVPECAEYTRVMTRDAGIQIAAWEAGCVWAPGTSPEQQSRVCSWDLGARTGHVWSQCARP